MCNCMFMYMQLHVHVLSNSIACHLAFHLLPFLLLSPVLMSENDKGLPGAFTVWQF